MAENLIDEIKEEYERSKANIHEIDKQFAELRGKREIENDRRTMLFNLIEKYEVKKNG